jgi:hypothetical protein
MFERFTKPARRAVVLAQEEARSLHHNYIGTEHILLGLIHEEDGVAARALASLDVSPGEVRARVDAIVGHGLEEPSGHIPFTPRAKKVLELALREALQLGHDYIGTEHMLLGVVREGEGVAAQVLVGLGLDLARVRQQVVRILSDYPPPPASPTRHVEAVPRPGPRPAECGFCGMASPECGTLYAGLAGALICEPCASRIGGSHPAVSALADTRVRAHADESLAAFEGTGPPPDDIAAAHLEVVGVFLERGELSADGESLVNVIGGENLGGAARILQARFGDVVARARQVVEATMFLNDHEAVLHRSATLDGYEVRPSDVARVVLVDGKWKVTRDCMERMYDSLGIPYPRAPRDPDSDPPTG